MAYTPPQFNLFASIWECRVPDDGDPDWTNVPVQKYIFSRLAFDVSPQTFSGWWEAWQPPIALRFPRNHAAFLGNPQAWPHVAFEVPEGSGQFYRTSWREVMHQGFPNEYAIILVIQCTAAGLAVPPPSSEYALGYGADVCEGITPLAMFDEFEDAPGTSLVLHPMDSGHAWTLGGNGGTWVIRADGDSAGMTAVGSVHSIVVSSGNFFNGVVDALIKVVAAATDIGGVIARFADNQNYYAARVTVTGNNLVIRRRLAGVDSSLATVALSTALVVGDEFRILFTVFGSSLSAVVIGPLGTVIASAGPVTDTSFLTQTSWGLYVTSATSPAFLEFSVTP